VVPYAPTCAEPGTHPPPLVISRDLDCIFVHQRKCAGMAVIAAFGIDKRDPDFHFANDGVLAPEWNDHPELVERCFTFAVVRNPWDRFVSGWGYCRSTRDRPIVDVLRRPPLEGHDYRHVTRGQSETLYRPDGTLAVDRLIRFENLTHEFAEVCETIGLTGAVLRPVNVGRRPPYREVFDDEARRLFEQRFADDIERLGYSF